MKPKVLIVLGGAIQKKINGTWRTSSFSEGDNFGILGDRLRIIAASYIYKDHPDLKIIASGGLNIPRIENSPPIAEVVKKELVALGVPESNIIEEKNSDGTFEQLKYSLPIARNSKLLPVGIISNEYHLPRIKALIKYIPELKVTAKFISAEKILIAKDYQNWKKIIKKAYSSKAMKERLVLEKQGIKDLKSVQYKFR